MADPRRKLITDAVVTRAGTLANLQVFRGEIDQPITILANSDRVGRHLVIYPYGIGDGPDPNLAVAGGDLGYGFRAICVAGFEADCEYLADQVDGVFNRWVPSVTGLVFGMFRPPPGYQSEIHRNDDVKPPRFWWPLQYVTTAVTTT